MTDADEWKLIGKCGVDSGQLLIMDPCYMPNQFQDKSYEANHSYQDQETGKTYSAGTHFDNYEDSMEDYSGKTPNVLISEKVWVKKKEDCPNTRKKGEKESYASISQGTIDNNHYQLRYAMGHTGLGVAFQSGYGDGVYPVYAKSKEGRIAEVKIVMIEDEEDDFEDPYAS